MGKVPLTQVRRLAAGGGKLCKGVRTQREPILHVGRGGNTGSEGNKREAT